MNIPNLQIISLIFAAVGTNSNIKVILIIIRSSFLTKRPEGK